MQQVTSDVIDPAYDTTLLHKAGAETVSGTKDFAAGGITQGGAAMPRMVQGSVANTTSGTVVDFTGLPAWVKRISVLFNGVSLSGTSNILIQLGTGATSYTTSGYNSQENTALSTVAGNTSTAGFLVTGNMTATDTASGIVQIANVSGNNWVESGLLTRNGSNGNCQSAGVVSLAAALTAVRITTVNGTDTFDAGSVNIIYEG